MRKFLIFATILVLFVAVVALAHGFLNLRANLKGGNEVPVVVTDATGKFRAQINEEETQISYELSYSDLEGTVTQAHIHVGQKNVNGGISVWLCGNNPPITTTPAGTQPCPAQPATISGVISPTHVGGPATQGIPPGDFADLLRAIRDGNTYANVHTTVAPGGEIRGQIGSHRHHDDDDSDDDLRKIR